MSGRKGNEQNSPSPDPVLALLGCYRCAHCSRPLELDRVMGADVERRNGLATGYVIFEHYCACDPSAPKASRNLGSHPSFVALFGTPPALPYRAPFRWQPVADDDATVARWRWELAQIGDFDEFMLFMIDGARPE